MSSVELIIRRIDTRQHDIVRALAELRERLSPRGHVVSEAGRRRTIEVFGEPLTPAEVVQRICDDVRVQGLKAVLDYSARIDRAQLTPATIRVEAAELAAAHAAAAPEFLATIRRIRETILGFQTALLPEAVICGSVICRSIELAFAFPAARLRILRPC
jgi:histidinol dehydrogenase